MRIKVSRSDAEKVLSKGGTVYQIDDMGYEKIVTRVGGLVDTYVAQRGSRSYHYEVVKST